MVVGQDGAAWVTDAGLNALVKVDPDRLATKHYPLPGNAANAGLNSATFDRAGMLWFTGQNGFYGRLDPKNGDIKVWPPRWRRALRHHHHAQRRDLVRQPRRQAHRPHRRRLRPRRSDRLTRGAAGPQRIWSDSKGTLWVSESGSGKLSRYDPLANAWNSWALPGDKADAHAMFVDEQDRIWISDFASNAILRFNPFSQRFTAFPSDQANARVLQLSGRIGEVWGAESGLDRLVMIRD